MRIVVILLALLVLAACVPVPVSPVPVGQSTVASDQASPLSIPAATAIEPTVPSVAASTSPTAAPAVTQSKSALAGRILSTTLGNKPLSQIPVRLGRVFWNAEKTDGAYVFEGGTSPGTITKADGTFVFEKIEPGDYVIAVGDLMGNSVLIREPNNKVKIFAAVPGKVVDTGTLQVALP